MPPFTKRHRDGSLWARWQTPGGAPEGQWERFRKDCTKLHTGAFRAAVQFREWTTYVAEAKICKVTRMKVNEASEK